MILGQEVKFSSSGTQIWQTSIINSPMYLRATSDGGAIVTTAGINDPISGVTAQSMLIRLDGQGNQLWTRTLSNIYWMDAFDSRGSVVALGRSGSSNLHIVKFNSAGSVESNREFVTSSQYSSFHQLWDFTYQQALSEQGLVDLVTEIPSGGFFILNTDIRAPIGHSGATSLLFRIDSNGNPVSW